LPGLHFSATHIGTARSKEPPESNVGPGAIDTRSVVGVAGILPIRGHSGPNPTIIDEGVDSALVIHPQRVCTVATLGYYGVTSGGANYLLAVKVPYRAKLATYLQS
jgi:hypothetical protein